MELTDVERRVVYRARRGLKELDFYLEPYVRERFGRADAAEREAFARLMTAEDPDLLDWLLGVRAPADATLEQLIAQIRALRHGQTTS